MITIETTAGPRVSVDGVTEYEIAVTGGIGYVLEIASGNMGPPGPQGPPGEGSATTLGALTDVALAGLADGDLISFNPAASEWVNEARVRLTDGGNF